MKQHLDDFDFITYDGVVLSPQIPSSSNIQSKKSGNLTIINTGVTVSKSPVRLYVGGLRGKHTEDQLRQYFAQYGVVTKCCIWRDFRTHESKRCGFVTFEEVVCASRALADRPHYIDGDLVKLAPFTPKKKKNKSAVPPLPVNKTDYIDAITPHDLVVDGLPPVPSVNDIRSLFGRFGEIIDVRVEEELHRAFVAFSTAQALQAAVAAAPPRLKGMNLRVSLPGDRVWRYAST
ncbi:unnamed protein product [Taenia asiatica]|uniref:RRM domain-containing protein n=1 Tax=Taenia asiatica TaxID=60517 RepID=A0A3P6NTS2_TAEAS|nr:unnamed protein product [Taenia asiatica]